jgi:hypothetical protein
MENECRQSGTCNDTNEPVVSVSDYNADYEIGRKHDIATSSQVQCPGYIPDDPALP